MQRVLLQWNVEGLYAVKRRLLAECANGQIGCVRLQYGRDDTGYEDDWGTLQVIESKPMIDALLYLVGHQKEML